MKFLVRFFIALSIFLLTGFGQLHATAHKDASAAVIEKSDNLHKHIGALVNGQPSIVTSSHYFQPDTLKFRATDTEVEEDNLPSAKKCLEASKYFTTALFDFSSVQFSHSIKKSLFYTKHFLNFSSYKKYIVFLVIRI